MFPPLFGVTNDRAGPVGWRPATVGWRRRPSRSEIGPQRSDPDPEGAQPADEGMDGRASARRWGWHFSLINDDAGAALLRPRGAGQAGSAQVSLWALVRGRVTWLQVLTACAAAIVALEFIRPVASHAPALRAAAESVITLLALLGAGALMAQFAHTRRLRDLLLFGALALFALVELVCGLVPVAL